jgi:hypothetical protein
MARELNILKLITHGTASAGAASVEALAANPRRLYAEIINASDVGIWLGLGVPAVIGTGIYLGPNGFSYIIGPENMWRGAVNCIASSGTGKVLGVHEGW